MKKIKFLLASSATSLAAIPFIAAKCGVTEENKKPAENPALAKVKEAWNNNIKDKISSAKNYTMILTMLKDSINDASLKESISLFNADEARKRPVKEQDGQTIMFKVGSDKLDLELGKVVAGMQKTIYVGKDGKNKETDAQDLSTVDGAKEATKIVQIGYYDDGKTIRVAQMPKTVTEVPTELPKEITNLHKMFLESKEFDQDISSWDLSGVYNTSFMFHKAEKFNQDITKWNTENVTNMRSMFYGTKAFDKDLSKLNVSSVKDAVEFAKASKIDGTQDKKPKFNEGTLLERKNKQK
ncbi:BspA family leucine-rich repeat surface protein [Mycoplasmopsis agalactiae]|uniref:BspA family leucine-rich repeat surface protein n=1 Tax=Mycoplasmopsis agalactiae TaxID=2110 RepID=UPI001F994F18|nr:BspA family leucine-rich repeat surface protein [Mycoplasmopsis agalactiae]MCE6115119.1 DUF285 domain-containing protein [Mycoplasmopsis agalactiae]